MAKTENIRCGSEEEAEIKSKREYFKDPLKKPSPRLEYHRNYNKKSLGFPEPKIKDITNHIEDIKKYPVDFPEEEFKRGLDKILRDNPPELLIKNLKDIIHDILDKKGTLTPERMLWLYYGSNWEKAIEEFMKTTDFPKKEGDKYVHK